MHHTYSDVRALFNSISKNNNNNYKKKSPRVMMICCWHVACACFYGKKGSVCLSACPCARLAGMYACLWTGLVAVERAGVLHVVPVRKNTFYCRYKCIFFFSVLIWLDWLLISFPCLHCNAGRNTHMVHISVGFTHHEAISSHLSLRFVVVSVYCLQWWSDYRLLMWSYDFEAKRIKDIFFLNTCLFSSRFLTLFGDPKGFLFFFFSFFAVMW